MSSWNGRIIRLVTCLCFHIESLDEGDQLIRQSLHSSLTVGKGQWRPGEFWTESRSVGPDSFELEFNRAQDDYEEFYEGIRTRFLGSAIINHPNLIVAGAKSFKYVICVRRIHDSYTLMLYAFARNANTPLNRIQQRINTLRSELDGVQNFLERAAPRLFQERLLGPPTLFLTFPRLTERVALQDEIVSVDSQWARFVDRSLCAKGVDHTRLPRSLVDHDSIIVRHPSYHYSASLGEGYLIIPAQTELTDSTLVRHIDSLSRVELYYTRFLYLLKSASGIVAKINRVTNDMLSSLMESPLKDIPPRESLQMLP